jgi:predicted nucleic acid-binding protein
MVVFDSNVFIYAANGTIDLSKFKGVEVCYASISVIEVLGYQEITAAEQRALQGIFNAYQKIELGPSIIEQAVALRQGKRMSLGDTIVAATAMDYDLDLWTANTDDFKHIEGLKIVDPLSPRLTRLIL